MASNEVKIVLTAVDNASKTLKTAGMDMGGMVKQVAAFAAPALLAGKAFDFLKDSIGDTMSYAKDVRDLGRAIGASAQESSRLIQIADDVEISVETLKMGFKTAIKQGITPNIAGLKSLAKEYQALDSPLKKSQFALKNFGRAGLEMNKILELSPEKIDEMAESAERAGLVMDEAMIKKTEEYRMAMDELSDSWMGLKVTLGTALVPALTDATTSFTQQTSDLQVLNQAYRDGDITALQYAQAIFSVRDETTGLVPVIEELRNKQQALQQNEENWLVIEQAMSGALRETGDAAGEAGEEIGAAAAPVETMAEKMNRLNQESKDAIDGLRAAFREDLQADVDAFFNVDIDPGALAAKLFDVIAFKEAGGDALNQTIPEIQAAVAEGKITPAQAQAFFYEIGVEAEALKVDLGEITAEEAAATISEQFNVALETAQQDLDLVIGGVEDLNRVTLDDLIGQFEATQERKDILVEAGEIPLTADPGGKAASALSNLQNKVNAIEGEHTVTFRVVVTGDPIPGGGNRQHGGPVQAGQVYMVGERGPELFVSNTGGRIVPNNQINIYGGVNMHTQATNGRALLDEFMAEISRQTRGAQNARSISMGG